jgi:hypothetical protein
MAREQVEKAAADTSTAQSHSAALNVVASLARSMYAHFGSKAQINEHVGHSCCASDDQLGHSTEQTAALPTTRSSPLPDLLTMEAARTTILILVYYPSTLPVACSLLQCERKQLFLQLRTINNVDCSTKMINK